MRRQLGKIGLAGWALLVLACGDDAAAPDVSTGDVGIDSPGDLVGLEDVGVDSQQELGVDPIEPHVEAFLGAAFESNAPTRLMDWGLSSDEIDRVMNRIASLRGGTSCGDSMAINSAQSDRSVTFGCLRTYRLGVIEAFVVSAQSDEAGDLYLVRFDSPSDGGLELLSNDGAVDQLTALLDTAEVRRPDESAQLAADMWNPARCDRSVVVGEEQPGQRVTHLACIEGPPVAALASQLVDIRSGDEHAGAEVLSLRLDPAGGRVTAVLPRQVVTDRFALESAQDLEDVLTGEASFTPEEAERWASNLDAFLAQGAACPRVREWVDVPAAAHTLLQYLPGNRTGWLESCHLRIERPPLAGETGFVITTSAFRGLFGGQLRWVASDQARTDLEAGLTRAFVPTQAASLLAGEVVDLTGSTACVPGADSEDSFRIDCTALYSGLPELGNVEQLAVVENGFDAARLMGAEPQPVSVLAFDSSLRVGAQATPSERALLVYWAPRTSSETLEQGTHNPTMESRLVAWGLPQESARQTVARLNALLAADDADALPLIVESVDSAVFFNRGRLDADGPSDLHIVHGLRRGGAELELLVLANGATDEDSLELRNPTDGALGEALSAILADFATPPSLIDKTTEAFASALLAAGCPAAVSLSDGTIDGTLELTCSPLTFDQPRPSLSNLGFLMTDFHRGEEQGAFPVIDVDFIRAGLDDPDNPRIADSLMVLHPQFDSPTLPRVLDALLVAIAPAPDDLVSDDLQLRSLPESEARLTEATLYDLADTGCSTKAPVTLEGGYTIRFGCLEAPDDYDFRIAQASLLDESEVPSWTAWIGAPTDQTTGTLTSTPSAFGEHLATATAGDADYTPEVISSLLAHLAATPSAHDCLETATVALPNERHVELRCEIISEATSAEARSLVALVPSTAAVTRWRVTEGESEGVIYWFENPTVRGDGIAFDGFFQTLADVVD